MEKQLNVWIDSDLKEALAERAEQEDRSLKDVTEHIISQAVASYRGEVLEQQALPMIRDLVQSELRRALAQLLMELREDVHGEIVNQMKRLTSRSQEHISDRIAALSVRTVRDGNINRRLLYTLLAKAYGTTFAHEAYENAKGKAREELHACSSRRETEEDK